MVTPQGDLRAGVDRAPSLTLSFLVIAALAGAMLTFPLFAEKLSVLLPALCLTLTAPYIYNSMVRATCTSLSFLIPPIWNGAAAIKNGDSALFRPDSPLLTWMVACQAWGILNATTYTATILALLIQYLIWLAYKTITALAAGTAISARHVFSVFAFAFTLVFGVAYMLTIMPIKGAMLQQWVPIHRTRTACTL